jgi:integrase
VTLKLDHGKGPIKPSELGKMRSNGDPDIYTPKELQAFFVACKPDEHLRYSTLREPAFRKEELMYLEKDDVLISQQMLRVSSKERHDDDGNLIYKYEAKADSERDVPIVTRLVQQSMSRCNT